MVFNSTKDHHKLPAKKNESPCAEATSMFTAPVWLSQTIFQIIAAAATFKLTARKAI